MQSPSECSDMKFNLSLLLLLLGTIEQVCIAQSPGAFTPTGHLTTPRQHHTATLLTTGKVLIAGGQMNLPSADVAPFSAELYDPSTGGFTRTGDMTTGRSEHTATLLTNGTVLIEGEDQNGDVSDDVYDPGAGIFAPTGGGTEPAGYGYSSAAALLTSAKVLLTLMFEAAYCDQAKLYDPTAGAFSATANMSLARYYGQTATVLPDGKVLVVGTHDYDQDHATADLYDPGAGTFQITGE